MSLTSPSLLNVAKAQYTFKLKAYIGLFTSLIALHAVAISLSLSASTFIGTSLGRTHFSSRVFSNELLVWSAVLWVFLVSALLTTKSYRDLDTAFVSSRLSSNLANGALLLTWCVIGGLLAAFGGGMLRIGAFFALGEAAIASQSFFMTSLELFVGAAVTALYMLLFGTLGYLCGTLVQASKVFVIVNPLLLALALLVVGRDSDLNRRVLAIAGIIAQESSLALLALKMLGIAGALLGLAFLLSNNAEVRN